MIKTFSCRAANVIEAVKSTPQVGSECPDYGFIVVSVTAKRISDWGTWLNWLFGWSNPKWSVEVAYRPKLSADEDEKAFLARRRDHFAQEAEADREREQAAKLGLSPKCPQCGSHRYIKGTKAEECQDCGQSQSYW
jgi:hypothetical protein